MIIFSRKKNESIVINDDIIVVVVEIRGDKVRLGIEAPKEVPTTRREVFDAIHQDDTMEPRSEDPMKRSGKPCSKCGQSPLVRVIWRKGKLSEKNLDKIRAGAAILGPQGEKGPKRVCLKCNPEWSEVHELAVKSHELQIKENEATETVNQCRKEQKGVRRRLAALSKKLLRGVKGRRGC